MQDSELSQFPDFDPIQVPATASIERVEAVAGGVRLTVFVPTPLPHLADAH